MFEQAKRNLIRFWSGDLFICTFIMMESQLRFGARLIEFEAKSGKWLLDLQFFLFPK